MTFPFKPDQPTVSVPPLTREQFREYAKMCGPIPQAWLDETRPALIDQKCDACEATGEGFATINTIEGALQLCQSCFRCVRALPVNRPAWIDEAAAEIANATVDGIAMVLSDSGVVRLKSADRQRIAETFAAIIERHWRLTGSAPSP